MYKLQSILYKIFLILFIPVMIIVLSLFPGDISEPKYIYYPVCLTAMFAGILWILKNTGKKISNKYFYIILFVLALLLLFIHYNMFCKHPEFILYGDTKAMYSGFREISSYGELTGYLEYFLAHPHQLFTALFYGVLNRIFVIIGLQGPVNVAATVATNCILIVCGGVLLSCAVKRITNNIYGLFTMIVFCLFNSYWGCILYAYTHTLSVFFICLMVFCFAYFVKAENIKSKFLWVIASGISFAFCKSCEGITLISFVAALIYIIISFEKLKPMLIHIGTLVVSFILTLVVISGVYNVLGVIDYTQQDRYEFPVTHWIMMGLGETGEYCEDDYQATVSLESKQEKLEMHKQEIARRITSRNISEWIDFIKAKQHVAWIGGTYGAHTDFPDVYAYNFTYRLLLVICILVGAVFSLISSLKLKNNKIDFIAFSQIYTIGIFLFFCIWEVSPSYLFSSIPMLIICAVLSLHKIFEKNNTIHDKENLYEQNI